MKILSRLREYPKLQAQHKTWTIHIMIDNKLLIEKIAAVHTQIKSALESIRDNTAHKRLYDTGQDHHFEALKTVHKYLIEVASCPASIDDYIAALNYEVLAARGFDMDYEEIKRHQRVLNDVANWFNTLCDEYNSDDEEDLTQLID